MAKHRTLVAGDAVITPYGVTVLVGIEKFLPEDEHEMAVTDSFTNPGMINFWPRRASMSSGARPAPRWRTCSSRVRFAVESREKTRCFRDLTGPLSRCRVEISTRERTPK